MTGRTFHRRGSMYVTVLLTATLVALIGVSGLLAARGQLQSSGTLRDVVAARLYAESAVELGLLAIRSDPDWRSTQTNDGWTAAQPIGSGTYQWKVVDEDDGNLLTNPSHPVRLYGAGMMNAAVRTYSVLVRITEETDNLLANPGIEEGLSDWKPRGDCDITVDPKEFHDGTRGLRIEHRKDKAASGPRQDVTDLIKNGATYQLGAWIKLDDFGEVILPRLYLRADSGWQQLDGGWIWGSGDWTQVTGTVTPTWTGTLQEAWWVLETQWSDQDFWMDDAVLVEDGATSEVEIIPIPGTWRREIVVP